MRLPSDVVALAVTALVTAMTLMPAAAEASSTSKSAGDDVSSRIDVEKITLKTQGKKLLATIAT